MMTRRPSQFSRLISQGAERLGVDPMKAVTVYESLLSELYGGGVLRVSAALVPSSTRAARRERIRSALAAGESPVVIAQRERVSVQWVRCCRRVETKEASIVSASAPILPG